MPKVTNAFTTYNAVGNREDLSNVIYNIDPFDTPVMSAIPRGGRSKTDSSTGETEYLPNVSPYPSFQAPDRSFQFERPT